MVVTFVFMSPEIIQSSAFCFFFISGDSFFKAAVSLLADVPKTGGTIVQAILSVIRCRCGCCC